MFGKKKVKRPFWVWIISAFYLLSGFLTLLSLWQIQSGLVPVKPGELADLKRTSLIWSLGGIIPILNLAGAVSLFLLKKSAFYIFMALLALSLSNALWQVLTTDWFQEIGGQGSIGAMIGYGLAIVICYYIYRLKQRGVLT